MKAPYRVLIVDDSPYARQAIREVLAADDAFRVVGEAGDARQAVTLAAQLQPDLVLMDVRMPGIDGIAATAQIKTRLPSCRVVIVSVSDDARDLFAAIRSGAQGYLLKNLSPDDWTTYLRQVMSDAAPISADIASRILQEFAAANPPLPAPLEALTPREEEILRLVAGGHTNREIAARLGIAEATVKNHLRNILAKLHLKNRTALATFALKQALVRAEGTPSKAPPG